MSGTNGTGGGDRALVVGPLAVPGFVLVLVGVRQRRRLFVLLGAVLVGLAVKLVDRPETVGETEAPVEPAEPEPTRRSARATKRASAPKPTPAAEAEPASPEPATDQPETA